MHAVVEQIAAARPDLDVRLAFLDLSAPPVDQVMDAIAAEGHSHAVVVPLLLGSAFHARVDLPGLLDAAHTRHPRLHLTQADVLGTDARLINALRDRIHTARAGVQTLPPASLIASANRNGGAPGAMPESSRSLGIAVAAVGSSSAAANARTAEVARRLTALTGWKTEICFATTEPTVAEAVARLRARGAEEVLVAPWFLAPGLLTDRLIATTPDVVHADALGPHPALTDIALDRYHTAVSTTLSLSA
ncbi:sirohydrochlorin chelatase [Nocardia sp. NPDC088792]|uniref:sirohydrochlorin chelatase n=1 Tax=Nocardia sp. NPDC088792 TaxID=3364332 RepID=UPI003804DABE